jgi:hypothetical protein
MTGKMIAAAIALAVAELMSVPKPVSAQQTLFCWSGGRCGLSNFGCSLFVTREGGTCTPQTYSNYHRHHYHWRFRTS